jgi:hypothetical protein
VLDRIKRWFGGSDLSEYEKDTLRREYRRLDEKIARIESQMEHVSCSSCPKSLKPEARKLLDKKRAHEDRQDEIEAKLGEAVETSDSTGQRKSRRSSA